jgi:hypothetical protein
MILSIETAPVVVLRGSCLKGDPSYLFAAEGTIAGRVRVREIWCYCMDS